MSDSEGDDYVYYGTALVQENALPVYSTKTDESATKSLPVHKQQVRDEQGRQRLHGAFTGGYSAGFFNSVGSVEGFQPASFRSSRSDRKAPVGQHIADFLDDDEKADRARTSLRTTSEYDTFGSAATAAAAAEVQREEEASAARGPGVPLLLPQDVLKPVASSIGVQLLQKMGWRPGKGLGTRDSAGLSRMGIALPGAGAEGEDGGGRGSRRRRWGPEASLLADATPLYLLAPKEDLYGLGYDPYENAEEFREARKRSRAQDAPARQPAGSKRQRGVAFAPSVLEETDVYGGELADYTADGDPRAGYLNEIVSDDEDEDALRLPGQSQGKLGGSAPLMAIKARQGTMGNDSFIEGFVRTDIEAPATVHSGPELPPGFRQQQHVFGKPCPLLYGAVRAADDAARDTQLTPVEPPSDPALKQKIDVLAAYVARAGSGGQELALKQHADEQDYDFLLGGRGAAYYAYKVAAIKRALRVAGVGNIEAEPVDGRGRPKLSVDQRASLLGEAPLPGTSRSSAAVVPPTQAAPQAATGAQGGGVERGTGLLSRMAAKDIAAVSASFNSRFVKAETLAPAQGGWTTAKQEQAKAPAAETAELPPVRTQEDWVPEALLCRRFNVPEPYKGRAAKLQRPRDSIDYLALPETERAAAYAQSLPAFLKPPQHGDGALPPPPPRQAPAVRAPPQQSTAVAASAPLPPPPLLQRQSAAASSAASTARGATAGASAVELDPAEALLAGMEAAGELGVVQAPAVEDAAALDDETVELLNVEKPLDLFKAIFENSDAEGSDDGDAVEADSRARDADGGAPPAGGDIPEAAGAKAPAQGGVPSQRGGGFHTDLGAALLKAQSLMAQRAAEARAGGAASGAAHGASDTGNGVDASLGRDVARRGDAGGYATDSSSTSEAGSLSPSDRRHVHAAAGAAAARGDGSAEGRPSGAGEAAPALDKAQRRAERKRKREELLEQALLTVRDGVSRQALSVKEIDGIMKALKKDKKHKRDKKKRKSKDKDKKAKKSSRHA